MYKLMVVAGPNRGASYSVADEAETSIGRQSGNSVVLQSSRVSKRHCVLVASNGELVVRDEGSSNGTFVNGVLSKEKAVQSGDRISVGEFVFEVIEPRSRSAAVIPISGPISGLVSGAMPDHGQLPAHAANGMSADMNASSSGSREPRTPLEKVQFAFESYVMPFFYGLALKNQWRLICMGVLGAFIVANMFVSISPLLESSRRSVVRESARRASFMARQIADRAGPLMASHAESRVEIGGAENAEGVRLAAVTDMDNRILAPTIRLNQYLTSGPEAVFLTKVRDLFRNGRETGAFAETDSSTVAAVEPVKVFNQQTGKNAVIGMAIVSIDTSIATMGLGDVGLVYSETLIISALLAGLALLILYRLTLKPFQVLSDDMDKVLKGDMGQVTQEFKFEEMIPLWDLINSALQRLPQSGAGFDGNSKTETPIVADDFVAPFRALATVGNTSLVVCDSDRRILYISAPFEEISGIRNDNSIGQDFGAVARDQAMAALISDLFDRAQPGSGGVSDDCEISGLAYKMWALSFGSAGTTKCYVLLTARAE